MSIIIAALWDNSFGSIRNNNRILLDFFFVNFMRAEFEPFILPSFKLLGPSYTQFKMLTI